jgi:hypothetical protein
VLPIASVGKSMSTVQNSISQQSNPASAHKNKALSVNQNQQPLSETRTGFNSTGQSIGGGPASGNKNLSGAVKDQLFTQNNTLYGKANGVAGNSFMGTNYGGMHSNKMSNKALVASNSI